MNANSCEVSDFLLMDCERIINEMNYTYRHVADIETLKYIADNEYNECNLALKIGSFYNTLTSYNFNGKPHDITILNYDFIIETKYLRNFKTSPKSRSNSINWNEAFQKNYNWLCNEITHGSKGKRAFVLGWFNAYEGFNRIMELGKGRGRYPQINNNRYGLFPFINIDTSSTTPTKVFYMYSKAYEKFSIKIEGYVDDTANCVFLGRKDDRFHFAIYY